MTLARRAKELGFSAVALEFDDFGNAGRWQAYLEGVRGEGVLAGAWVTSPWNLPFAVADFYVSEVETDDDYEGLIWALDHRDTDAPHAVVTNYNGLRVKRADGTTDVDATRERCAPLVEAGFYCQYEAYFYSQPDNTDAEHCGFPGERVAPVIGVKFNGKTLDQQTALQVPGFGVYLIENA